MARSDAKLKTLPEEIQAEMWRMRKTPVDAEGRPCKPKDGAAMSQAEVLAWLEDTHGIVSSAGAFSEWERWYPVEANYREANETAEQSMENLRRMNPDISPIKVMEHGQLVFSMKAMRQDDAKTFARFADIFERREARLQDAKKFDASQKSAIEKGLEALGEFIKGNKAAEKAYADLRKVIAEATK